MSKRKNRLAFDPMDSPAAQALAGPPAEISMGSLERFVVSDEIEKIDAQALVPSEAQIVALADFAGSSDTLEQAPPPRWCLQIAEQVEALGFAVQSIDLDRGAAIRAASCAITVYGDGRTSIVARGSAERADAAIAQALETLRWLVEPA